MARERHLSHSKIYRIVDYNYLSILDGGGTICQNCGAIITNMVTVACSDGNDYVIGTDCAKTLTSIGEHELKNANMHIGQLKKFYKKLADLIKYGYTPRIAENGDRFTLHSYITKDFMGKPFDKPFSKYEDQSIPKDKAYMPLIEPHLKKI